MIEKRTQARPYAKAIFELACQDNTLAEWSTQLSVISKIVKNKKIKILLSNSTLPTQLLADQINSLGDSFLNIDAKQLVQLLANKKRLFLVPTIQTLFETFLAQKEQKLKLQLTTAFPLEKAEKESFVSYFEKKFDKTIEITAHSDPTLLGGYIAAMGDRVIDHSLKGSLQQLMSTMGR